MVHCGYDPSGALGTNYQRGDNWKNIKYNFASKPKPYFEGKNVMAFNGCSVGKGHLAEAKAAVNAAQTETEESHGCSSGDTSQRDGLLAKIGQKKSGPNE
jgi:hypothetical protein